MADPELRTPVTDEMAAFLAPAFTAFGDAGEADGLERERRSWEPDRSVGFVDDGRWVACSGAFSFELTVPGEAAVPMSAITMVAVSPTHRRRGLLRRMMTWLLDDAEQRGEPIAGLTASESSIYGRFGFGLAASAAEVALDTDRSGFLVEPPASGTLTLVDVADDVEPLVQAYERCLPLGVGMLRRTDGWWSRVRHDPPGARLGASPLHAVVHRDAGGVPDGYATWRIRQGHSAHNLTYTAEVSELVGVSGDVEAVLWRFLCDIDLVTRVTAHPRPVDDALRWRLAEPRQLRTLAVGDWLWVRLLDVAAALGARAYAGDGRLVVDVDDPYRPGAGGTYALEVEAGGATCSAAPGAAPDLVLGAADLGALYLGGVAASTLAAAGRVHERSAGALATADRMFVTHPAPFCNLMF